MGRMVGEQAGLLLLFPKHDAWQPVEKKRSAASVVEKKQRQAFKHHVRYSMSNSIDQGKKRNRQAKMRRF